MTTNAHRLPPRSVPRPVPFLIPLIILSLAACASTPHQPTTIAPPAPALTGVPGYYALGGNTYQEADVDKLANNLLSLVPDSEWFEGFGKPVTAEQFRAFMDLHFSHYDMRSDYPRIPNPPPVPASPLDLPTTDHGVQLQLSVQPATNPAFLEFHLTLQNDGPNLTRVLEHRHANILPFLFAFYVDGHAVALPDTSIGEIGGIEAISPLVPAGQSRTWNLYVDARSLQQLLPDTHPHRLDLLALFSNSQHRLADLMLHPRLTAPRNHPPLVLLRSNPAVLHWTGTRWTR